VNKPVSPKVHGIIDYLTVPLLVAAGPLFGFDGLAARITSTLAGVMLIYSAATAYPPGVVKIVSLSAHRTIDRVLGLLIIATPWICGFADVYSAKIFFVVFGIAMLTVVSLTNFSPSTNQS
jgi:hypothetical protein